MRLISIIDTDGVEHFIRPDDVREIYDRYELPIASTKHQAHIGAAICVDGRSNPILSHAHADELARDLNAWRG